MAPEYMKDVQGFNLLGSGALASLPFIINLIVVFVACISLDYLLHKVRDSRTTRLSALLRFSAESHSKVIMTKLNYEKFGIYLHSFLQ